jgi:hypothetical protein
MAALAAKIESNRQNFRAAVGWFGPRREHGTEAELESLVVPPGLNRATDISHDSTSPKLIYWSTWLVWGVVACLSMAIGGFFDLSLSSTWADRRVPQHSSALRRPPFRPFPDTIALHTDSL